MGKYDRITSACLLFLSILICILSVKLPVGLGTLNDPGPGFLPFWSGIFLGALSITLYVQSALKREQEGKASWFPKEKWLDLVLVLAALFVYAILLERVGFLVCTTLLMFFLFKVMGGLKLLWAVGGSIIFSLASYGIFYLWLKVQLPKGFFGI
jgi:putative tricarboxylic transport membrane protein